MSKSKYYLVVIISFLLVLSCQKVNNVVGHWESEDRDLIIMKNRFKIVFHNTQNITSFCGSIDIKNEFLILKFEEYVDSGGVVNSLKNTELEDYIENMRYTIKNEYLETWIESTGKKYAYKKSPD